MEGRLDPHQMLNEAVEKGLSLEIISNVTGVSVDHLKEIQANDFSNIDFMNLNYQYLYIFLPQLLMIQTLDQGIASGLIENLKYYFSITSETIANLIGISADDLEEYATTPEKRRDRHLIELRLLYLHTTLVRDRWYSLHTLNIKRES